MSKESKDKILSIRVPESLHNILKSLSRHPGESVSDVARQKIENSVAMPSFILQATDLLSNPQQSYISVLKRFLEHSEAIGRADYLFLVYAIQSAAYLGDYMVPRFRFLDLIDLQARLVNIFENRNSKEFGKHYLLTNLNSYGGEIGHHNDIQTALHHLRQYVGTNSKSAFSSDYMLRNIQVLLENSGDIDEGTIGIAVAPSLETLVTIASKGICKDHPVPSHIFSNYFFFDFTNTQESDWFHLKITSASSGFMCIFETKGAHGTVFPLDYKQFATMTSPANLVKVPQAENYMLCLPGGARMILSQEDAVSLRQACTSIRSHQQFKPHDWVLSLINGVAE